MEHNFKIGDRVICTPYGMSQMTGTVTNFVNDVSIEIKPDDSEDIDFYPYCSCKMMRLLNKWNKICI